MAEYIFTNLPQYIRVTPRTDFSNSVVQPNHVLLFSEDGATLTGKLPDGTFITIGGSMDFYKCASVDTVNHTWTGYKAVLNSGVYSFESTVTSGLTYGSGYTPAVGSIYDDGALVYISGLWNGIPVDGLVFHASLSSGQAETGQTIQQHGSGIAYTTYKGIPCVHLTDLSSLYVANDGGISGIPSGNSPWTMAAWCCLSNKGDSYGNVPFGFGQYDIGAFLWFSGPYDDVQNIAVNIYNNQGFNTGSIFTLDTWYHMAVTWDGTTMRTYIDGTAGNTSTPTLNMSNTRIFMGAYNDAESYPWRGYIAGCRIYNRALSAAEVSALAGEFTPSTGA